MKREEAIPILLGFLALEFNRWLAEDDTPKGHIANAQRGVKDHGKVMEKVLVNDERNNNYKPK